MNQQYGIFAEEILFSQMPAPTEEIYVVSEAQLQAFKNQQLANPRSVSWDGNISPYDIYGPKDSYKPFPGIDQSEGS